MRQRPHDEGRSRWADESDHPVALAKEARKAGDARSFGFVALLIDAELRRTGQGAEQAVR